MDDLRLAVVGAGGRMGRTLLRAIADCPGVCVGGALERPGSAVLGQDAGAQAGLPPLDVPITDDMARAFHGVDCIVDFTAPEATRAFAAYAANNRLIHIIGTTGLAAEDFAAIAEAGQHTTIVRSGNMSLGVNLLAALVKQAAKALGEDFDIEIVEMHHRNKVDAPSGTALLLGEAAAEGRGIDLKSHSARGRDGITGARRAGDIGFATLRGGTVIGDHAVTFAGAGERIELAHRAEDRSLFATGAMKAALWARGKPPGVYSMADVLGMAG